MNAARFMGQVTAFCMGMALWKLSVAAYHGSHDAKVSLLTLGIFVAAAGFAIWCYWGDDK